MAIGARSQSARTYLERKLDSFPDGRRKGGEGERERERGERRRGKKKVIIFFYLYCMFI